MTKLNTMSWPLRLLLIVAIIAIPIVAYAQVRELSRGDSVHAGQIRLSDGSSNWLTFAVPSLAADQTITFRPRVLYASTATSAAHTGATAAETTVMPTAAEGAAATDIGADALVAGAVLPFEAFVVATGDADGDETLTVNVYFGSQLVGTSGAIAVDGATEILLRGSAKIKAAGASGTGVYATTLHSNGTAANTMDGAAFTSFDTTATQAFVVKLDWGGTTDAADTATVHNVDLRVEAFD